MKQNVDKIKKLVYDQYLLEEEIKKFPHTYKTLLTNDCCNNGTLQFILRRKLNTLHKEGYIHKCIIPGTRFGEVIFYHPNKKYKILIEGDRSGVNIYCFFKFKKNGKYYLNMNDYWELVECNWKKKKNEKTVFLGSCLKMV